MCNSLPVPCGAVTVELPSLLLCVTGIFLPTYTLHHK